MADTSLIITEPWPHQKAASLRCLGDSVRKAKTETPLS